MAGAPNPTPPLLNFRRWQFALRVLLAALLAGANSAKGYELPTNPAHELVFECVRGHPKFLSVCDNASDAHWFVCVRDTCTNTCRAVLRSAVQCAGEVCVRVCVCVWRGRGVSGRAAHHNEHTGLLKTSTASMISHPTSNASTHFVRTHGTHGTHGRKCLLLLYTSAPFDGFDVPISEEFGRVTAMCRGWHAGGHTGENSDAVLALIRALARCVRRANSIVDALLQPSHCHWCREP